MKNRFNYGSRRFEKEPLAIVFRSAADERSGHGRGVYGKTLLSQFGPGRPGRTALVERLEYPVTAFWRIKFLRELAFAVEDDGSLLPFSDLSEQRADGG